VPVYIVVVPSATDVSLVVICTYNYFSITDIFCSFSSRPITPYRLRFACDLSLDTFDTYLNTKFPAQSSADEIRDLNEQLNDKDHRSRDLSALVKRLETEKEELQSAVEEADTALEQSEAKVQRAVQEQADMRAEMDKRLAEKETDFETTR